MDYVAILSRSWKIIWKYKVLWIFGILASCGQGGNRFNYNLNNGQSSGPGQGLPPGIERWFQGPGDGRWIMIAVVAVFLICLVALLVAFLSTIGRIGLIKGASQADQDDNTVLPLGGLFSSSLPYFWRIFILNLIVTIIAFVVFGGVALVTFGSAMGIGALASGEQAGAAAGLGIGMVLFFLCLCCILIPLSIVVGVILEMAYMAIVIEELSIAAGLSRGWQVLKDNIGHIVLLWVILGLGIGFIGGLIISAPFLVVAVPAMMAVAGRGAVRGAGIGISLLCCAIYLPIMIVLRGILESYIRSAWTVAYRRFIGLQAGSSLPAQPAGSAPAEVFDLPAAA